MTSDRERRVTELLALDNRAGPYRFTHARAEALIESALDSWQSKKPRAAPLERRKMFLLAAAIFALASGAAAFFLAGRLAQGRPVLSDRPHRTRLPLPSASVAPFAADLETGLALAPTRRSPNQTKRDMAATDSSPVSRSEQRVAPADVSEDPLRLANRLRGEQKWHQAEQAYRRVASAYADSPSRYVALVAAAAIRLEHLGDPAGALALYRQSLALNPDGVLDLEARLGVARCWRARGDARREGQALAELLRRHPSGPLAGQARKRLERLGEISP